MPTIEKAIEAVEEVTEPTRDPKTTKRVAGVAGAILALLGTAYTYVNDTAEARVQARQHQEQVTRRLDDLEDDMEEIKTMLGDNQKNIDSVLRELTKAALRHQ